MYLFASLSAFALKRRVRLATPLIAGPRSLCHSEDSLIFFISRLDLRPNNADADSSLAPPLDAEASTPGTGNRRRTRIFELHYLRYATAEERIEALRQYRAETQAENGAVAAGNASADAGAAGEDHSRDRLSRRLRDKFRIRTRAQPPSPASNV